MRNCTVLEGIRMSFGPRILDSRSGILTILVKRSVVDCCNDTVTFR